MDTIHLETVSTSKTRYIHGYKKEVYRNVHIPSNRLTPIFKVYRNHKKGAMGGANVDAPFTQMMVHAEIRYTTGVTHKIDFPNNRVVIFGGNQEPDKKSTPRVTRPFFAY